MAVATVPGIILAGGRGQRMGGIDKAFLRLGRQTLLEHTISRLRPQCSPLLINANGDPGRFAGIGLEVIADTVPGHQGPLAGLLAGLIWASVRNMDWIVTIPVDTPFLPEDLVQRLLQIRADADYPVCAASGDREHPVIGLWPVRLKDDLLRVIKGDDGRSIRSWAVRHGVRYAVWNTEPVDPFFNINRREDLLKAGEIAMNRLHKQNEE